MSGLQQQLKNNTDGLPKAWKVHDSHEPFYSGGKTEVILSPPTELWQSTVYQLSEALVKRAERDEPITKSKLLHTKA